MPESPAFDIDPSRTALIVVDMQNDFVRVGAPLEVPDARATIEPTSSTVGLFRRLGRPVVFTRFIAGPKETLLWRWSPQLRPPVNCCKPGFLRRYGDAEGELDCIAVIDELPVEPGDYAVDKYWYGAFFRTNLYDILLSEHVDTAVVCGTVTQICVEETAREAFHLGLKTVVLSDCVSSFDPQMHAATLKNFASKFGRVLDSGALAGEMG
ncbi:MAG: cysteine hydrolase [Spirochaetales bacterium]|nr:cysteine hydrolase [Spirochaetales bacterium]